MRVNIPQKVRLLAVTLLFVMGFGATHALAQTATPTPTPESEETRRLRELKTNAELRRDIAAAENAEFESKFPKPSTTPLAGTTTINDGAVIEGQMISYLSLAYAANDMVRQLKSQGIKNLAIYNERDIKLLQGYVVITKQIDLLQKEYDKFLKPPQKGSNAKAAGAEVFTLANSFLGGFVDLLSFLRTNVDIKGFTFDVDEAALVSEVFRAAKDTDGISGLEHLYYPAAFHPDIDLDSPSPLLAKLEELRARRELVAQLLGALEDVEKKIEKAKADLKALTEEIAALKAKQTENDNQIQNLRQSYNCRPPAEIKVKIGELQNENRRLAAKQAKDEADLKAIKDPDTGNGTLKDLNNERDTLAKKLDDHLVDPNHRDEAKARLKTLNDQFDKIIDSFLKVDDNTGVNSLTSYLIAENLNEALCTPKPGDKSDVKPDDKTADKGIVCSGSYWLQLKVLKAGGNNKIKTNLIWDVFTGGNRTSYSGGVIVQYILYKTTGEAVASDTFTEYTGYIKSGKVKRLGNPASVTGADSKPQRESIFPK